MAVAVVKNASSQLKQLSTEVLVECEPVPDEASVPNLAAQIAEEFRKFLLVIALGPGSSVNGEAVLQENSGVQWPCDLINATERPSPFASASFSSIGVFVFGDVTVSFVGMEVRRNGKPVALTSKEFKTLGYMIHNRGRVISREELLNEVWGYECYPCTRTVDNHILRLRHKLEAEPSRPKHFLTAHGAGYKFLL